MFGQIRSGIRTREWWEMSKLFRDRQGGEGFGALQSKRFKQTSSSSKRFLRRAETDPYGKTRARQRGERVWVARSAHKLLAIDEQYGLFPRSGRASHPGARLPWRVLEMGAAPGGWTEVVLDRLGRLGPPAGTPSQPGGYHQLVTCDLQPLSHSISAQVPPHVSLTQIQDDVRSPDTAATISRLLQPGPPPQKTRATPTVILSDMLTPVSGLPTRDAAQSFYLAQDALSLARTLLSKLDPSPFDFLLLKHLQSEFSSTLKSALLLDWDRVSWVKPLACRSESREGYFLARGRKSINP